MLQRGLRGEVVGLCGSWQSFPKFRIYSKLIIISTAQKLPYPGTLGLKLVDKLEDEVR